MHTNIIVPSDCITPSPIGAPHSPQIIICPSCDDAIRVYRFEIPLYDIKICPITFGAADARRRLRDEEVFSNTKW